ncbi:hypothetical protein [Crocinitomix catalasitica]|uniref:hypothetical protein n=1 Tax=Crocinitomix catalasitica TaxID=184607 RepID=UPI000480BDC6|nr:hypothetical protein [Crocinitomix catalasitica]
MTNRLLAVLAGTIAGVLVIFLGDILIHTLFPAPGYLDMRIKGDVEKAIELMPIMALVLMLFYWLLSSFIGGLVAGKIAKHNWQLPTIFTGIVLLMAAVFNMISIPHPIWMVIIAIVLYVPAAYYGGKIMNKKVPKKKKQKKKRK